MTFDARFSLIFVQTNHFKTPLAQSAAITCPTLFGEVPVSHALVLFMRCLDMPFHNA